jgi:pyruvate ferredoxin oxidoreductase delta subunit
MQIPITADPSSTTRNKTGGWRSLRPLFDHNKCISCGTCSRICPEGIITMKEIETRQKPFADYDFCKGCGLCATECPVKAIEMKKEEK